MKILIVKLSSIGDVIHTLPVLPAIKNALPQAEISWIVEKKSAEILRGNPLISNLVETDTKTLRKSATVGDALRNLRGQIKILRREKFDIALDFQGLLKSAAIAKLSKSKRRAGFSKESLREPASRFLLTETVKIPENIHIVRKNLALCAGALGIKVAENNFDFPIFTESNHQAEAAQIINQTGENFAILNPAGGWETKLWHAEKFGRLADKLWQEKGITSVVTTAPNEKNLAERVSKSSESGKVIQAVPTLKGFYELAKRAKIYVGGDTGPTFLAVAAKCPIVGIFGPTEWRRNGSPDEKDICVERTDISCRVNCYRRTCSNWICMDISVETVFEAIERRLDSSNSVREVSFG